ncbi:MAG: DUF3791 domain-containing protein [Fibromonadales bacterium]|nr:DUF3791 domain-containing protein [Fibromonadales bacterium]
MQNQSLKMTQAERDANLMLVVAVEEYSQKYNLAPQDTLILFTQNNINHLIRKNYGALHTQDLDESFHFAEDILARKLK